MENSEFELSYTKNVVVLPTELNVLHNHNAKIKIAAETIYNSLIKLYLHYSIKEQQLAMIYIKQFMGDGFSAIDWINKINNFDTAPVVISNADDRFVFVYLQFSKRLIDNEPYIIPTVFSAVKMKKDGTVLDFCSVSINKVKTFGSVFMMFDEEDIKTIYYYAPIQQEVEFLLKNNIFQWYEWFSNKNLINLIHHVKFIAPEHLQFIHDLCIHHTKNECSYCNMVQSIFNIRAWAIDRQSLRATAIPTITTTTIH